MNAACIWIRTRDATDHLRKVVACSSLRGRDEVAADLRLYRDEQVGRAAAGVFVIDAPNVVRLDLAVANVGKQLHRLLVEADHRLIRIVLSLVRCEHVLYARDVLVIELWNAPHFFPTTA